MWQLAWMSAAFLFPHKVQLKSGQSHTLVGTGKPLLLSSGLYGTMPSFMYNTLIQKLKKEFTLILPNGRPILTETIDELCDALGAQSIVVLAHSSVDHRIFTNPSVQAAVCIDPVAIPSMQSLIKGTLTCQTIIPECDVLVIRTQRSQESDLPFIPDGFDLNVDTERDIVYEDIGHADMLDKMWADVATSIGIQGLTEYTTTKKSFSSWSFDTSRKKPTTRKLYRDKIAQDIIAHFCHDLVVVNKE